MGLQQGDQTQAEGMCQRAHYCRGSVELFGVELDVLGFNHRGMDGLADESNGPFHQQICIFLHCHFPVPLK
jgi:hypothetical protein